MASRALVDVPVGMALRLLLRPAAGAASCHSSRAPSSRRQAAGLVGGAMVLRRSRSSAMLAPLRSVASWGASLRATSRAPRRATLPHFRAWSGSGRSSSPDGRAAVVALVAPPVLGRGVRSGSPLRRARGPPVLGAPVRWGRARSCWPACPEAFRGAPAPRDDVPLLDERADPLAGRADAPPAPLGRWRAGLPATRGLWPLRRPRPSSRPAARVPGSPISPPVGAAVGRGPGARRLGRGESGGMRRFYAPGPRPPRAEESGSPRKRRDPLEPELGGGLRHEKSRRRPTLPGGLPPSTIGAGGLNCRVRNGNGCFPAAMATGNRALGRLTRLRGSKTGAAPVAASPQPLSVPKRARA